MNAPATARVALYIYHWTVFRVMRVSCTSNLYFAMMQVSEHDLDICRRNCTWNLLWYGYKAKPLNKSRVYNSCNDSLIRVLWSSCICLTYTFSVMQVSNHNHESCRSSETWTRLCNVNMANCLVMNRVCNSSNKKMIRDTRPLYTCPFYILTLLYILNHYFENCRKRSGDTNPTPASILR